ncbi:MAG: hypothetical protein RDV48_25685 [Candidatus Eremiobacteraeota bacterium]|nr:hypothetical protein [Candidatus Eremiobacteraeota bacterium]
MKRGPSETVKKHRSLLGNTCYCADVKITNYGKAGKIWLKTVRGHKGYYVKASKKSVPDEWWYNLITIRYFQSLYDKGNSLLFESISQAPGWIQFRLEGFSDFKKIAVHRGNQKRPAQDVIVNYKGIVTDSMMTAEISIPLDGKTKEIVVETTRRGYFGKPDPRHHLILQVDPEKGIIKDLAIKDLGK